MKNMTPLNHRTVRLQLKRFEICDLILACISISSSLKAEGQTSNKWDNLHEKLNKILIDFDEMQGDAQHGG